MARVMMTCPNTQEPVAIGREMDEPDFHPSGVMGITFHCSACGQTHTTSEDTVYLEVQDLRE